MRTLPQLAALWIAYLAGRAIEAARHTPPSPPPSRRRVRCRVRS